MISIKPSIKCLEKRKGWWFETTFAEIVKLLCVRNLKYLVIWVKRYTKHESTYDLRKMTEGQNF